MPVYHWAQYCSGVVGAAILIAWAVRWWRRTPVRAVPVRRPSPRAPLAALAAVLAAGCVGALWGGMGPVTAAGTAGIRDAAFEGGTRAVALAAVVVLVLAAAWRASDARRHRSRGAPPGDLLD
jgi:hypothetical protein